MDKTNFYVVMQNLIERSAGAITWSDVSLAIKRAKEAKIREQLASIFSSQPLQDLQALEDIADREVFSTPPPLPAATSSPKPLPMHGEISKARKK